MMDFRDMLSADLPAPRDDQPGNLRDDILERYLDGIERRQDLLADAVHIRTTLRIVADAVREALKDPALVSLLHKAGISDVPRILDAAFRHGSEHGQQEIRP